MIARRRAFTLVELLVTLAVISVVSGVAALAFRVPVTTPGDDPISRVLSARRQALREGRPVTIEIMTPAGMRTVTAYPNATIVADSEIGLDRIDVAEPKRRQ